MCERRIRLRLSTIKTKPKNTELIANAIKTYDAPAFEANVAKNPAKRLAIELLANQTPIIKDDNLSGDNFVTIDKPIGDKHNSPTVCIK